MSWGAGGGGVCVFACFDGVSKFFWGQNMVMLGDNEQVPRQYDKDTQGWNFIWMSALSVRSFRCFLDSPPSSWL